MENKLPWFKPLHVSSEKGVDPFTEEQATRKAKVVEVLIKRTLSRAKFRKKAGRSRSNYLVLFSGPSGTGKTLAANRLGNLTGKEVYRIDLSMVVSKYIGETEKNLARIFEQGMLKDWILFFDEADALFGKRTQVKAANDRFASQGKSFLLQQIQEYPGVVILASKLQPQMRSSFRSRINSIIHFPMPGPGSVGRVRFWRKWFLPKTK